MSVKLSTMQRSVSLEKKQNNTSRNLQLSPRTTRNDDKRVHNTFKHNNNITFFVFSHVSTLLSGICTAKVVSLVQHIKMCTGSFKRRKTSTIIIIKKKANIATSKHYEVIGNN